MSVVPDRSVLATVLVLLPMVLFGVTQPAPVPLGDGTASIEVVSPDENSLRIDRGRFGSGAVYLRLPDLVVEASDVTGRPRVVYTIAVPRLDLDRQRTQLLRETGRVRVHMSDRAYPPRWSKFGELPQAGTYTGHLSVRVQSFSTNRVVLNRTVTVRVPE